MKMCDVCGFPVCFAENGVCKHDYTVSSIARRDLHCIPPRDVRDHLQSVDCDCKPYRDAHEPEIVVHNAFDKDRRGQIEADLKKIGFR